MEIQLKLHQSGEAIPFDLLLKADPDKQKIDSYLSQGDLYLAKNKAQEVVGVYVIQEVVSQEWEILNIAVVDHYQNQGIGQQIIDQVVVQVRRQNAQKLWVATANSSIGQLAFYQKCGFEMHAIIPDFFTQHYTEPIIENGIVAKHQVRLLMKL